MTLFKKTVKNQKILFRANISYQHKYDVVW